MILTLDEARERARALLVELGAEDDTKGKNVDTIAAALLQAQREALDACEEKIQNIISAPARGRDE